jgi:outer membrane protein assembly factor BamA
MVYYLEMLMPYHSKGRAARSSQRGSGGLGASCFVAAALVFCGGTHAQQTPPSTAAAPTATPGAAAAEPAKRKDEPAYQLTGFMLNGTERVDTDALVATLPQHKGDMITLSEIKQDTDRLRAVLAAKHVHGQMTTALLHPVDAENKVLVVWEVHQMDALAQLPFPGRRHFGSQTFSGNVKLSQSQLETATGLKPGRAMPDGSVADARTGIEQAYNAAFPGKTVGVSGKVIMKKDRSIVINWHISEPK